mmetsp:Transcript_2120/g.8330  ORF Transcript_2120/g.8330 Transcript_2120/m.8330 type:complete len:208 (-) Transcript_2120:2482-3105(-)
MKRRGSRSEQTLRSSISKWSKETCTYPKILHNVHIEILRRGSNFSSILGEDLLTRYCLLQENRYPRFLRLQHDISALLRRHGQRFLNARQELYVLLFQVANQQLLRYVVPVNHGTNIGVDLINFLLLQSENRAKLIQGSKKPLLLLSGLRRKALYQVLLVQLVQNVHLQHIPQRNGEFRHFLGLGFSIFLVRHLANCHEVVAIVKVH